MEQIIIRIRDRKKTRSLLDFLKSLDFVESVTEKEVSVESPTEAEDDDFFALAGLWSGRDISLKSLHEQAWTYCA